MAMKRLILLSCICGLLSAGCIKDPQLERVHTGGDEVWSTLDFGHTDFGKVDFSTRSTLGPIAEARVSNLYVFLFNSAGERVFGHYFDDNNKLSTRDEVVSSQTNCWMVDNRMDESTQTTGTIRMKIPQLTGGKIRIVANFDSDMFNISSEQFSFIQTIDELDALTVALNQQITSRTGIFVMTGSADDVTVTDSGITASGQSVRMPLTRLDAKIDVRVRAAVGNETTVTTSDGQTMQNVRGFTPVSWRVVNVPVGSFLFERSVSTDVAYDADEGFFDSPATNFETSVEETFSYVNSNNISTSVTAPVHGFSFYMYENRPVAKKQVSEYHQRDRRIKDDTGAYDTSDGMWEYAPETATYLVIDGEVEMLVDVGAEAKEQALNATVTYYIHLGDIAADLNDFSVNRNTHYTYTITVKGVKSIQVEVSTDVETESGATGEVYIAKESIYTFDAHYGQRVFAFDEQFIAPDEVTWYVKTPFGREGLPEMVNGVEVPNGLDYKWVSFRINDIDASSGQYSHRNCAYHPDEVVDIIEFCDYIRDQKRRFDAGRPNDFRSEEDPELKQMYPDRPDIYTRNRIYVTAFVDEFYYDRDPISGEARPTLWKEFVNQPNRTMHILCDTQFSADGDSSATGSVVTIRQRSIQSIFDVDNENLNTAWGCESIDETDGDLWFYSRNEYHGASPDMPNFGNTSRSNGLYNTARLWLLTDGDGNFAHKSWGDYLDYDRDNDYNIIFLKDTDDLATARYTCMMRNRDNNGDGIIDASEIRWYIASIQQLTALYIGDQGISGDAQLYDRYSNYAVDEKNEFGGFLWRKHVISSTRWGGASQNENSPNNYPTMLWTEEGLSTSAYQQYSSASSGNKPGGYSVRCVRNLGMDPVDETSAVAALNDVDNMPEYSIVFETVMSDNTANSVYRFDVSRINKMSKRYYTSRELEPGDEFSEAARLYSVFETGPVVSYSGDYLSLKRMIENGESPCPEGYRTPNIREASLMSNYITSDVNPNWWTGGYTFVSSYYSFGALGKKYDTEYTWYCTGGHVTISPSYNMVIRCVRDVK